MHIGWKIPIWKNHPIKMGRSSEDDGEIVEIWKNSPIADECVGKDWVNIWNDKKTPNAGENVIVMRCHSHYAALHAHVALARYTSSPKISRLWASSHGWFRPACAPLVETRKFKFVFPSILENGQSRLELPTHYTNYAIFSCLHRFLHQMM